LRAGVVAERALGARDQEARRRAILARHLLELGLRGLVAPGDVLLASGREIGERRPRCDHHEEQGEADPRAEHALESVRPRAPCQTARARQPPRRTVRRHDLRYGWPVAEAPKDTAPGSDGIYSS